MSCLVYELGYENSSKFSVISYERIFLSLKGCSVKAVGEGMGKME